MYTIPYNIELLLLLLYFKLEFQTQMRLRVPSSKELETMAPFAWEIFKNLRGHGPSKRHGVGTSSQF